MPYQSGTHGLRIATAGFLAIFVSHLIGGRATFAQDAAAPSESIKDARDLVADLESQAESQREQLRRTEANLRRARSLLETLQGRRVTANKQVQGYSEQLRAALPAQKIAEQKSWKWSDDRTNPQESAAHLGRGYSAAISPVPGESGSQMIRLIHDDKVVYSWKGHARTVFVRHDDVLYYADFRTGSSGCTIVAVDLNAGKPIWKTHLLGIPVPNHSQYSNLINITFDEKYVVVYGNESFGRYIELVDPTTGRTVGNRRIPYGQQEPDAERKPIPSDSARE